MVKTGGGDGDGRVSRDKPGNICSTTKAKVNNNKMRDERLLEMSTVNIGKWAQGVQ